MHSRNTGELTPFVPLIAHHDPNFALLCREHRCQQVAAIDQGYVDFLTMPDGEMQAGRDASMRANHAEGRNPMEGDMDQMLEELRVVCVTDLPDESAH